jgi:hypothetical protein
MKFSDRVFRQLCRWGGHGPLEILEIYSEHVLVVKKWTHPPRGRGPSIPPHMEITSHAKWRCPMCLEVGCGQVRSMRLLSPEEF